MRNDASWAEIGFMQGRLSPMIDGKIQAFPWPYWRREFALATEHGFSLMEWTLDQDRLYENPLMTVEGRREIGQLCEKHGVKVGSLTGDCFMQAPFHKASGLLRKQLLDDLEKVVESCADLGITRIVMPLEDNGRLENQFQEENLMQGLSRLVGILRDLQGNLLFESDYAPEFLAKFIRQLDPNLFGINYDIGNSASRGYNVKVEMASYGDRIRNVHVKDRKFHGATIPLGEGNADTPAVLQALKGVGYPGPYILQTARAVDGDHVGVLCRYRDMVAGWLRDLEADEPGT